ncbi:probable E3 ubiquitin-protein ligase RNF144A-A [Carassius auratus]|uniref:RBR-type E3 ubiquitin transferase n=1 Tax=Carassius auratus TaxID=7957 RepID=A0A6P6NP94_CARAU|nr:probable E3 ubiquitin-protein ligase RNF144A-A [Carassius auratus]XP_026110314.1 probable E3 ubiquitin-protein ligase RNF144A-A [Carassius auratus]
MTTARYRPTWDLALDPLVSCKLCLGEFPLEQMTTITQCQCVFCTLCLKHYVELLIKEGFETAISCPDSACPKRGHLQENEIECMVAAEIMQRYRKLQFEKGKWKADVCSSGGAISIRKQQMRHVCVC